MPGNGRPDGPATGEADRSGADSQSSTGRGGGRAAAGGGGGDYNRNNASNPAAPDTSTPSPKAETPPQNGEETIAPQNIPPSDLTLRQVKDLLQDKDAASKLEQATGMSREEMEQFVQKFQKDKAPRNAPRSGQEVDVKPGATTPVGPAADLPGVTPGTKLSTRNQRKRGSIVQDEIQGNLQGTRFVPPAELLPGFEAYSKTLSRSRTLNPTAGPRTGAGSAPMPAPAPGSGTR